MERHHELPDVVYKPEVKLRTTGLSCCSANDVKLTVSPSDVQKEVVVKEEQQEWNPGLDQEDPEPPHIKEEQEEVWTSQEGEQLRGLEEVKEEEEDEEKPPSSQLHQGQTEQMKTEADGEDCGGPGPDRDSHLTPDTEDETGDSSETEVSDADWEETRGPPSRSNSLIPISDVGRPTEEKPFGCSECGKTFSRRDHLVRHVKMHTGEKLFSCSVCGKRFTHRTNMTQHMAVHTGEKRYGCSVCDRRFTWSAQVKTHRCVVKSSQLKSFSCSTCSKTFNCSTNLKAHMRIHTGEKPFSCSDCKRRFTWHHQLQYHRCVCDQDPDRKPETGDDPQSGLNSQTHHEASVGDIYCNAAEKPCSCSLCHHSDSLKTQLRASAGEKPFKCSVCGERFPQRSALTSHIRTHARHKRSGRSNVQRRSEPGREHLQPDTEDRTTQKHMVLDWTETRDPQLIPCQTAEKMFSCSECGKRFSHTGNLNRHMRAHTGEKPFSCSACGRSFADKATLIKHTRTHTGEKPFGCSVCGKRFIRRVSLKHHSAQHARRLGGVGESSQTFSCCECGKTFGRKDTLQEHLRTHSGEKPFSCSECSRAFSRRSNLKTHMRIHSGEKPFGCSGCQQSFIWHYQLKQHQCDSGGLKPARRPRPHDHELCIEAGNE